MQTATTFSGPDAFTALSSLAALGFNNLKVEDLNRLRGADPEEQEIIIMAEVRAYFQVAYKVRSLIMTI